VVQALASYTGGLVSTLFVVWDRFLPALEDNNRIIKMYRPRLRAEGADFESCEAVGIFEVKAIKLFPVAFIFIGIMELVN
jgi:hypothetical protein